MRFFIDTANVEEIRKANDMGVICGVTTNPSLIAKEGRILTKSSRRSHLLWMDRSAGRLRRQRQMPKE